MHRKRKHIPLNLTTEFLENSKIMMDFCRTPNSRPEDKIPRPRSSINMKRDKIQVSVCHANLTPRAEKKQEKIQAKKPEQFFKSERRKFLPVELKVPEPERNEAHGTKSKSKLEEFILSPPKLGKKSQMVLGNNDFEIVKHIGRGSYADVFLVKNIHNQKTYALKKIDKLFLRKESKEYQAFTEKSVLKYLKHPGIIQMHATFQTENSICFLLDYLENGDFSDLIKNHRKNLH